MTHRSISILTSLALAATLAAGPLAAGRAVAQEAIMLETIGAVRMARPEEARRIGDDAGPERPRTVVPAPAAPERHAAVVD